MGVPLLAAAALGGLVLYKKLRIEGSISQESSRAASSQTNPRRHPRRYHRRVNPLLHRVSHRVEHEFFQGTDLVDIGVATVGLLGTQKLIEPIVEMVSPTTPAGSPNAWWVEPLASLLAAAAIGYGGSIAVSKRVGKDLAIGGGITAGLNILKHFPVLQGLVGTGSITVGSETVQPWPKVGPKPYPPFPRLAQRSIPYKVGTIYKM